MRFITRFKFLIEKFRDRCSAGNTARATGEQIRQRSIDVHRRLGESEMDRIAPSAPARRSE